MHYEKLLNTERPRCIIVNKVLEVAIRIVYKHCTTKFLCSRIIKPTVILGVISENSWKCIVWLENIASHRSHGFSGEFGESITTEACSGIRIGLVSLFGDYSR